MGFSTRGKVDSSAVILYEVLGSEDGRLYRLSLKTERKFSPLILVSL